MCCAYDLRFDSAELRINDFMQRNLPKEAVMSVELRQQAPVGVPSLIVTERRS